MLKKISHLSAEAAADLPGDHHTVMVSITSPGQDSPIGRGVFGGMLHVEFDDIDKPWQNYTLLSEEQAAEIVAFIDDAYHNEDVDTVLVHCAAGISRSAAVCEYIAKRYGIHIDHERSKNYNRHVYQMLCLAAGIEAPISEMFAPYR